MTRRILLIEDEPLTQDIICTLLQGQGYVVDVAADGFTALERARSVRYDVALIDYHLPEMDGYTLGRLLREQQHPGRDDRPVLIGLTADRNGLAARRGSDAVFRAILPKPIKPADLFATVDRVCQDEALNQDAAGDPTASADLPPQPDETRHAAARLWRSHGLPFLPKAYASPSPTTEQSAALTLCFDLVGAEEAQFIILMERHGINEAVRAARRGKAMPLPIIALSADHADICDGLFRIDDPASWAMLAAKLRGKAPAPVALRESNQNHCNINFFNHLDCFSITIPTIFHTIIHTRGVQSAENFSIGVSNGVFMQQKPFMTAIWSQPKAVDPGSILPPTIPPTYGAICPIFVPRRHFALDCKP